MLGLRGSRSSKVMLDFVTFQNCKLQRYILRSYSCLYVSFSFFLYSNSDIQYVVVNQIKPFLSKWGRVLITFTYIFFFASRPFIEWNVSSCRAFWIQVIVRFLFFFLLKLRFYNVHWRSLDHQSLSKFRTSTTWPGEFQIDWAASSVSWNRYQGDQTLLPKPRPQVYIYYVFCLFFCRFSYLKTELSAAH